MLLQQRVLSVGVVNCRVQKSLRHCLDIEAKGASPTEGALLSLGPVNWI